MVAKLKSAIIFSLSEANKNVHLSVPVSTPIWTAHWVNSARSRSAWAAACPQAMLIRTEVRTDIWREQLRHSSETRGSRSRLTPRHSGNRQEEAASTSSIYSPCPKRCIFSFGVTCISPPPAFLSRSVHLPCDWFSPTVMEKTSREGFNYVRTCTLTSV